MFDHTDIKQSNDHPASLTVQKPPIREDNLDAQPVKSLPVDDTGMPVGVGGAGQQKSPFTTVGLPTPRKDAPETKPLVTQSGWTWNWPLIGMLAGGALLLLLVLFNI